MTDSEAVASTRFLWADLARRLFGLLEAVSGLYPRPTSSDRGSVDSKLDRLTGRFASPPRDGISAEELTQAYRIRVTSVKYTWWRNLWVAALLSGAALLSSSPSQAAPPDCGPRMVQEFFDELCDDIPWWTLYIRFNCELLAESAQLVSGGVADIVEKECCTAHDACYTRGGSKSCKATCDHKMSQCVADKIGAWAYIHPVGAFLRWGTPALADLGGTLTFNYNNDRDCGLAKVGIAKVCEAKGINPLPDDRRLETWAYPWVGESLGGWNLAGSDKIFPKLGDFNGDHADDFVIQSGWGIGVISGSNMKAIWGAEWDSLIDGWPLTASPDFDVAFVDIDGDQIAELILHDGSGIVVFDWDLSLNKPVLAHGIPHGLFWGNGPLGDWRVSHNDRLLVFGDFDGNGSQDALLRSSWGIGVLGMVSGRYTTITLFPFGTTLSGPSSIASTLTIGADHVFAHAAPFGHSGRDEILVQGPEGTGLFIARLSSSSQFVAQAGYNYGEVGGQWRFGPKDVFFGTGDFNGDRYHDVIVRSERGIGVLMSNKDYTLQAPGYAMHPFYSSIGGWYLQPTDKIVAVVNDLMFNNNFPELIIQSNWGLGVIEWRVDRIIVNRDETYTPFGGRVATVAWVKTGKRMDGPGGMPERAWHVHHNDFVAASGNFAQHRGKHIAVIFQRR